MLVSIIMELWKINEFIHVTRGFSNVFFFISLHWWVNLTYWFLDFTIFFVNSAGFLLAKESSSIIWLNIVILIITSINVLMIKAWIIIWSIGKPFISLTNMMKFSVINLIVSIFIISLPIISVFSIISMFIPVVIIILYFSRSASCGSFIWSLIIYY